MNLFSINKNKIVVEENEKPLINLLEGEYGFDVCPIAYRHVFEFGGSLHCSTWDVRRTGKKRSLFENRDEADFPGGEDFGLQGLTQLP